MLDILRSTAKSTFIYSIGNLVGRLAGFILIPLYTSKLVPSEYGILGILDISSQVFIALFGLGLNNAIFRWYWDKKYLIYQKSVVFTTLVTITAFSAIILLIGFSYSTFLSSILFDSEKYSNLIILLFALSAMEAINIVFATMMRLQDKAVLFSALMVIKLTLILLLNIYFIVYLDKSVEGIYYALITGSIIYAALAIFFLYKEIKPQFVWGVLKSMLKFSFPLLITALTGIVLNVTDRYLLKFLTDFDIVGKYSLGFKLSNTLRVFLITSVNMALQPVIFKMMDHPDNKRFYSKIMTYYSFGLIIVVLALSLFSFEIVKLITRNTDYWPAYKVIPIISLGMFFTMLRDVSLTGINISKKTIITARIITISMLVNIPLCYFLINILSYIGAAIATCFSQILFFILVYRSAQKVYFIPFEIKKILLIIIASVVLYLLSLFTTEMTLILRIVIKGSLLLLFPVILYFFGFYEKIELERLQQFWLKWKRLSNLMNNIKSLNN